MNGMEAKYTAKHLAKMIKHNRKVAQRAFKFYDSRKGEYTLDDAITLDKFAIAQHVNKEAKKMSLEFRAFMIHNAFKKNRNFTSAEVRLYNLGENAIADLKQDNEKYSLYMDKFHKQQKAIKIVQHTMLSDVSEQAQFSAWIVAAKSEDNIIIQSVHDALNDARHPVSHNVVETV